MSFTIKVKEEIIAASSKDKAELSALIKMSDVYKRQFLMKANANRFMVIPTIFK